jgi:hypothetical protein
MSHSNLVLNTGCSDWYFCGYPWSLQVTAMVMRHILSLTLPSPFFSSHYPWVCQRYTLRASLNKRSVSKIYINGYKPRFLQTGASSLSLSARARERNGLQSLSHSRWYWAAEMSSVFLVRNNSAEKLFESSRELEVAAVRTVHWRRRRHVFCTAGSYFLSSEVVFLTTNSVCRSRWPQGLRRGCAAARLLGLWVLIPPGGVDACLLHVLCVRWRSLRRADHSSRGIIPTVCVCVCVSLSVIRCNNDPLHLQWVGRRRSE